MGDASEESEFEKEFVRIFSDAGIRLEDVTAIVADGYRKRIPAGSVIPPLRDFRDNKVLVANVSPDLYACMEGVPWSEIAGRELMLRSHDSLSGRISERYSRSEQRTRARFSVGDADDEASQGSRDLVTTLAIYMAAFSVAKKRAQGETVDQAQAGVERLANHRPELMMAVAVAIWLSQSGRIGGEFSLPELVPVVEPAVWTSETEAKAAVESADGWEFMQHDARHVNAAVLRIASEAFFDLLQLFFNTHGVAPHEQKDWSDSIKRKVRALHEKVDAHTQYVIGLMAVLMLNDLLEREQPWATKEDRDHTVAVVLSFMQYGNATTKDISARGKYTLERAREMFPGLILPRNSAKSGT